MSIQISHGQTFRRLGEETTDRAETLSKTVQKNLLALRKKRAQNHEQE